MPARKSPAPVVPVLPTSEGFAYTAEAIAPVITAWFAANGIPKEVSGLDVRNVVRGRRKGIASPVPRLLVRPAFGNRSHTYSITEAADVFATFGRIAGQPDLALPLPFRGRTTGATPKRPTIKRQPAAKVARVKADAAPAPTVAPVE